MWQLQHLKTNLHTCSQISIFISHKNKKSLSNSLRAERLSSLKTAATYSPTCAVPSAWAGLTSLFGMGRGGTPLLSATWNSVWPTPQAKRVCFATSLSLQLKIYLSLKKFRAISSARLWRYRLYTCTLSTSSSLTTLYGDLILWPASHLDAFSAYPIPT